MVLTTLGVIGGLGTAAGSVGGLFGPKGSSSARAPTVLNPGVRTLNTLFGQPTTYAYSSRGAPSGQYHGFAEGDIFGPNIQNTIGSYLQDPRAMVPGTNTPLWSTILGGGEGFGAGLDRFRTGMAGAVGTAAELAATGLPTDGSAYFDEAIRRLRTEVTPMLAETSGFGTQGSGFLHGGYNASQDLLGQASLANIDLAEAATNRRLSAAPLWSTLLAAEQSVPLNIGTMLGDISNQERLGPVNLFSQLYGLGSNQGPMMMPSFDPQNTGANYGAAMQGISGILNALGSFNQSGGTNATSPDSGAHQEFLDSLYTLGGSGY